MTRSARRLMVLVGAISMLALAFAAAFPVWAQDGGGGGTGQGQGGETVALGATDSLGSLVNRYSLTGNNLRQFFSLNTDLVLEEGQTITFPAGVTVNMDAGGTGTGTGGDAGAGGAGGAGAQATGTPGAGDAGGGAGGAGAQTTGTPGAGDAGGGAGAQGTATPDAGAGAGAGGAQGGNTYVTQEGDILGEVLMMMGFQPDTTQGGQGQGAAGGAGAQATGTPGAGAGAGGEATGTPGAGGAGGEATGTPGAGAGAGGEATGTPGAGDAGGGAGAQVTGTPAAGGAGGQTGQQVTDAQLQEFVDLNTDLQFVTGQMVTLPQGIVVTGQTTGTPTAGGAGAQATGTPGAGAGAQATGTPAAGQAGQAQQYTVQAGENLADIANRFGVTLEQLLDANPNLVPAGTVINVPAQQGNIPQTGTGQQGQGAQQGGQTGTTGQAGQQAGQQGQDVTGEGITRNLPGAGFNVGLEHDDIPAGKGVYIVMPGESLSSIADKLGISVDDIRANNPGLNGDTIFSLQRLIVPAGENPGMWMIDTPGLDPFENARQNQNQGETQGQ